VEAVLKHIRSPETREIFWQLVRFGFFGGLSTLIYAAVYWPIATYGQKEWPLANSATWPVAANLLGYVAAVLSGYVMHSRWSFRGHGTRGNLARTGGRFFATSLVSLGMNTFFVWLLTGPMHGPTWWPLVPAVFFTPLITFVINRLWVFA